MSDPNIRWSVIDRWGTNPLFVKAVTRKIEEALNKFDPADREKVVLLFSAHSYVHAFQYHDIYANDLTVSPSMLLTEEIRTRKRSLLQSKQ